MFIALFETASQYFAIRFILYYRRHWYWLLFVMFQYLMTQFCRSVPGKPPDMNNFQRPPISMQNNMAPGIPPQPRPPTMMSPPSSASQVYPLFL